jgi:hypothetical protein
MVSVNGCIILSVEGWARLTRYLWVFVVTMNWARMKVCHELKSSEILGLHESLSSCSTVFLMHFPLSLPCHTPDKRPGGSRAIQRALMHRNPLLVAYRIPLVQPLSKHYLPKPSHFYFFLLNLQHWLWIDFIYHAHVC